MLFGLSIRMGFRLTGNWVWFIFLLTSTVENTGRKHHVVYVVKCTEEFDTQRFFLVFCPPHITVISFD